MSTNNINQTLDEYFQTALQWMLNEMSKSSPDPTPAHVIEKFQLVCLDDKHDREMLRQERLRKYHDSDRVLQLERLKNISQNIPDELRANFARRLTGSVGQTQSHPQRDS